MLKKDHCYIFELVSRENRIVTWYDDDFVALIGVRNLNTFTEIHPYIIKKTAEILGVKSPKFYDAKNIEGCKKLFNTIPDDQEGFVVVDNKFNRIKIKQQTYLKMANIKMLKKDDMLDYVRGLTELDGELLQKDKKIMEEIELMRQEWEELEYHIIQTFKELKNNSATRKEFALQAVKFPFKGFLFALYDNKNIRDISLKHKIFEDWCFSVRLDY